MHIQIHNIYMSVVAYIVRCKHPPQVHAAAGEMQITVEKNANSNTNINTNANANTL